MPPAKRTARKATKRATTAAKKTSKRSGPKKMSAAHKNALAEGRTMSATVDRYLSALNTPKQRGRKVSSSTLRHRLTAAEERLKSAVGVAKVLAAQDVRDLRARLADSTSSGAADIKALESAFVRVASKFGQNRGISYSAWRDAGVSAPVLKRAGVARTRG
jgi:hypothetical protein